MVETVRTALASGPARSVCREAATWLALLLVVVATVAGAQSAFDFGDAPDSSVDPMWSYPTLLADDGARHLVPETPTHFLDGGPTPFTERVSLDSSGVQANQSSSDPSISADARYVAFESYAENLVPGDTNGVPDVFVHDRDTGTTVRVSVGSDGGQANGRSYKPSISADGRHVAFESHAENLVPGDTNGAADVFVHDRDTGATVRVSVGSDGGQADGRSDNPSISSDGRYVTFESEADNLVPDDTNEALDVFVHDLDTGTTVRVSVGSDGGQANGPSDVPSISADGRHVAFRSLADNLVPDDTNNEFDVFIHDLDAGSTVRVSVNSSGVQANQSSSDPSISADARFVAFESYAENLVPGDTNEIPDVFIHDRDTGSTTRVSVRSGGGQANGLSAKPSISADGRYVAFESYANDLVRGDTNGRRDVFSHDRATNTTKRVSVSSSGGQGNEISHSPSISANADDVAFVSRSSNLVPGDTNGTSDVFAHGNSDPLDAEPDGAPTLLAIGDDRAGHNDEDGVRFPGYMEPGATASLQIEVSAAGFVNAWIDFDFDGDWGDGEEQILTDHPVAAGWNELSFAVPAGGEIPRTYARVRFTSYDTAGSLGVNGQADDGEVEDYWVESSLIFLDRFESGETSRWSVTEP